MPRLFITLIFFLFATPTYSKEPIKIAAAQIYVDAFKEILNGRSCNELAHINLTKTIHRGVADLLIICKSFYESALDVELEFTPVPNYVRGYTLVKEGKVHINAETIWQNQHNDKYFYLSESIIEDGEFEVGIYVPPHRFDLLKIKTLDELRKYSAVSQRSWVNDWALLESLRLRKIHAVSTIPQMFKMVGHGRIDFLLWTFTSNPLMSQRIADIELFPIPGIKFTIPDSRHFAISKESPNAYKVFHALNAGVLKLKEQGLITKIYQQAGFLNKNVTDWQDISPSN